MLLSNETARETFVKGQQQERKMRPKDTIHKMLKK